MTRSTVETVAVTGATGFIGHHVCEELIRRGYRVRALARELTSLAAGVEGYQSSGLTDERILRRFLHDADAVIHLAGRAHVMNERRAAEDLYRAVNVDGTRAIAAIAAAEGVQHIIFASSVKAVGEAGSKIFNDATVPRPVDAYGRSKLEAERILYSIAKENGFNATVVRLPVVYGPGVKGNVLRLFDAVERGFPLPVGAIHNERSMLAVDNLLSFLLAVLKPPVVSEKPFLVSDREEISTESLVRMIGTALGRKPRIFNVPVYAMRAIGRAGDVFTRFGFRLVTSGDIDRLADSLRIDSSRAWSAVGIAPPVSVEEGIRRVARWYIGTRR